MVKGVKVVAKVEVEKMSKKHHILKTYHHI